MSDGFKFENGKVGIVAIGLNVLKIWKSKKLIFGGNKEVFDVELWDIHLTL